MKQNIPYKFNPFPIYYKGGSIEPPVPVDALTFTGKSASNAVALSSIGSPDAVTLSYSKNNGSWTAYTINDIIQLNQNETVAFSGANDHFSKSFNDYYNFIMTGSIEADGNIQSLLNFSNQSVSNCFRRLFYRCTSLVKPPSLPVIILTENCYDNMFARCVNLTAAPQLPASGLADGCYHGMFSECTSLSTAPELPATTLAQDCYNEMFYYCSNLTAAPALPALSTTYYCYRNMFRSCIKIQSALLPATMLYSMCYDNMFKNCQRLSSIQVAFTDWNAVSSDPLQNPTTTEWLYGVAASGTFTKPAALSTVYGASYIPTNWIVQNIDDIDYLNTPMTYECIDGTAQVYVPLCNGWKTLSQDTWNGNNAINSLSAKIDDGEWFDWKASGFTAVTLTQGQKLTLSGNNNNIIGKTWGQNQSRIRYDGTGKLRLYGNISSLLDNPESYTTINLMNFWFQGVGSSDNGNSVLVDASKFVIPYNAYGSESFNIFVANQGLTGAPLMLVSAHTNGMFNNAFNNNYALSAIEIGLIRNSSWNYSGMTNNVQTNNGIFILPSGTYINRGTGGVPNNWTVLYRNVTEEDDNYGKLYYAETANEHTAGDQYNGQIIEDPYAWYYNR